MSYSAIRHSNFEGVGCCTPRARSSRDDGSRGASANGRLTPSRIGGARGSGAASDGRRQSSPPSFTDKPSRLRPSDGCPVGSLRRPRVPRARPQTYHFFGDSRRGNILALALYPRSLLPSLRPFASTARNRRLRTSTRTRFPSFPSLLFGPSSFKRLILIDPSRATPYLTLFILRSCLSGFAEIESNRGPTVSTSRRSERRDRSGLRTCRQH